MRNCIIVSMLLLLSIFTNAQVKTSFNSFQTINSKGKFLMLAGTSDSLIQVDYQIPSKNILDLLLAEKAELLKSEIVKPFQFAVAVPIDLDIANLIKWTTNNDTVYGKYTIKANGALTTSINFDKFYLPKGIEMYIYNEKGNMITGPITENENNAQKVWGSWIYKGEYLTIEIKIPTVTKAQLILHANNVAYGYKDIYGDKVAGFGDSGPCEINVLCPLGNGWENERNSVGLMIDGTGTYACSGSLIMNTCNSNRPFFLTANHCFVDFGNPELWRFTFQAWSPTCTPSQNSDGVMYNGSTLRANWDGSDFCLVELNNIPPANSGICYAGWSKSSTPAQTATGIHHPMADVMKISMDNNPVTIGSYNGNANHWQVNWSPQDNGNGLIVTPVTEPGSSGSPLFDQNHHIVGQLHGGPSMCDGTQLWDFYGRFDVSWTGGGTDATRLSNWLDQNNYGVTTVNTANISCLTDECNLLTILGDNSFCTTSNPYTISNLPTGAIVTWSAYPSGIVTINSPNSTQTTITGTGSGQVTLTATINFCGTNIPVSKTVIVATTTPIVGNFSFLVNGPSCISGNGQSMSFGVGYNGYNGCQLNGNTNITNVQWQISYVPSNANSYSPIYNAGAYSCPNGNDVNNAGISLPFSYPTTSYVATLRYRVQNACGYSLYSPGNAVTIHNCNTNYSITASPNPATSTINVSIINNPAQLSALSDSTTTASGETNTAQSLVSNSAGITNMYLYDFYTNQLVKKWNYQENSSLTYNLNVARVKRGIYVLKMERDNISSTTKVILQ